MSKVTSGAALVILALAIIAMVFSLHDLALVAIGAALHGLSTRVVPVYRWVRRLLAW